MSFDRIRADLRTMEEKLSSGDAITGADFFSMIRDLCEDVRTDTGTPVEKHPSGDTAKLLQQLPWMGRMISRQYRQIEDQIMDTRRQAELDEKIRELDQLSAQLEHQAGETSVLEDKQRALRSQRAALEAGARRKLELQQECEQLESQIRAASLVTLPQLQEQLAQLQSQLEQARQENVIYEDRLKKAQTAQRELTNANEQLRLQCVQSEQLCQSLLTEKAQLEQERIQGDERSEQLTAELTKLRQDQTLMAQQLEKAAGVLSASVAERQAAEARLTQLRQDYQQAVEACDAAGAEADALAQELENLTPRRADLLRSRDSKAAQLEQLRQTMTELDGECAQMQQQLDQLTHDLADKDREQAKLRLAESIRQREQALAEYHELQIQIAEQKQALVAQDQVNQAAIGQQQELKWQAEQEAQKATQRIMELQKQIGEVRARQAMLTTREMELKEQARQLEDWLRSLELEQYTQQLERMRQRNELLLEARAALEVDMQRILAARGIAAGELNPGLFQASFQDTEKWITHHQKLFGDTVRLLSSKE